MNWQFKIELNSLISILDDEFDLSRYEEDAPVEVKEKLALEVSKVWPTARFANKFREAKTIAEVNRILESVFDTCDKHRVWCGF